MKKHSFSYDYLFFLLFIFTQLIGVVMTINTQISSTFHLTPFRIAAALLLSLILAYPLSILSGKALRSSAQTILCRTKNPQNECGFSPAKETPESSGFVSGPEFLFYG